MHQLRIVFTCLCAYLPRPNEVLVVIPDGRKGHSGHAGHGGGHEGHDGHEGSQETTAIPPHVPVIEFNPADLSPQSEVQPDLLFSRPGARRDLGLVFLTGQDIRLDPEPSGTPTLRGGRASGNEAPQSAAEAEDFTWIAEVGRLDAGAGVMDPACIAPGTSADDRVAARMSLHGGTLAVRLLGLDSETREPIRFEFVDATAPANKHTGYSQALAAGVEYALAVLSEEVTLVLKSFDDGPERRLVFSFAGLPTGGTIEILIKNMPLEGVLELVNTIRPDMLPEELLAVDTHFAMYYALSATPPQTPWIPSSFQARLGGPICPGARFTE